MLEGWQASLILLELLHTSYCWQDEAEVTSRTLALAGFVQGDTPTGCLYPYLKSMPCWQSSFLELESRRSHGSMLLFPRKAGEKPGLDLWLTGTWHRTQGIWFGSFIKLIDWASDKLNIKCKSLWSFEVVSLRTKFKGLTEFYPLGEGLDRDEAM